MLKTANANTRAALLISLVCLVIGITILNPFWISKDIHVPGEPESKVDFTQPVDTVFYVRNLESGYSWDVDAPTSLWFHPLLVVIASLLPDHIPANIRVWLVTYSLGTLAVIELTRYVSHISDKRI